MAGFERSRARARMGEESHQRRSHRKLLKQGHHHIDHLVARRLLLLQLLCRGDEGHAAGGCNGRVRPEVEAAVRRTAARRVVPSARGRPHDEACNRAARRQAAECRLRPLRHHGYRRMQPPSELEKTTHCDRWAWSRPPEAQMVTFPAHELKSRPQPTNAAQTMPVLVPAAATALQEAPL
jgi:hypothetical protein